jgi:hypothetical protein
VETHGGRFRIYKGVVQGNCFCGERQRIRALGKKQFFCLDGKYCNILKG